MTSTKRKTTKNSASNQLIANLESIADQYLQGKITDDDISAMKGVLDYCKFKKSLRLMIQVIVNQNYVIACGDKLEIQAAQWRRNASAQCNAARQKLTNEWNTENTYFRQLQSQIQEMRDSTKGAGLKKEYRRLITTQANNYMKELYDLAQMEQKHIISKKDELNAHFADEFCIFGGMQDGDEREVYEQKQVLEKGNAQVAHYSFGMMVGEAMSEIARYTRW